MENYYVYELQLNGSALYVGKGSKRRAFTESDRARGAREAIAKHGPLTPAIVMDGLTEMQAFDFEAQLIAKHGRLCEGGVCTTWPREDPERPAWPTGRP